MNKRVAIVVGAGERIGSEIAKDLELDDFLVYRIWHKRCYDYANSIQVDDPEKIEAVASEIFEAQKRIDCLVNAAGKVSENPALNTELNEWHETFSNNLDPAFLWSKAVAKYMLLNRFGRIIHISSIVGSYGGRGEIAYAASKSAMESMVRILALELGRRNITVNAVAPGVIESAMSESIRKAHTPELLERIAARRFGQPADVAALVSFLASDGASYINGQTIAVDGGMGLG